MASLHIGLGAQVLQIDPGRRGGPLHALHEGLGGSQPKASITTSPGWVELITDCP